MELTSEAQSFILPCANVSVTPKVLLIGMDIGDTGFKVFDDGSCSIEYLCHFIGSGHLLINPWWSMRNHDTWTIRLKKLAEISAGYPNIKIVFLCNDPLEIPIAERAGFKGLLVNHNAFSQEAVFQIIDVPKKYKSIYNAKLTSFKRHFLASKIDGLALMYSRFGDTPKNFESLKQKLPNAIFLNGDPRTHEYQTFNSKQVAYHLNQSESGLCLSEVEGAMYGSIEYLLCGIPIVSTPSLGGRDVFFDNDHCSIVPPEPEAISNAVCDLISRRLDPQKIRSQTLRKIHEQRSTFISFINKIKAENGHAADAAVDLRRIMSGPWCCWTHMNLNTIRSLYSN